jgi:ABC-type Zn uptake system ZnuABC Zn-binding protein ZnuA
VPAKLLFLPLVLLAVGLLLFACGDAAPSLSEEGEAAGDEADAPDLAVVAKLPSIADMVTQVLGDRGEVHSLIPLGADSHTFEPRPGDARRLNDTDLFFANGLELNAALLRMAEANLPEEVPIVRLAELALDDDEIVHDHVHDARGGHTHGDDGHTHGDEAAGGQEAGPNPHAWMHVGHARDYVRHISDALSEVDPDGASDYEANADAYLEELERLDAAIEEATETVPSRYRKLVTYHDSWSYFGPRYGLDVVAAIQPADFSEPSAAEVRRIIDQIEEEDVPAVFGSEAFPSDVLEVIAEETGVDYVGDLSDDDLPGAPGDPEHSYIGLMVHNARLIVEALGGDPGPLDRVDPGR